MDIRFLVYHCILIQDIKKRTTTIFPLDLLLKQNVNSHEIFISDQILLKLECDIDEFLYLLFVGTKHTKANDKRATKALCQRCCLQGIPNMFYICKV